MSDDEDKVDRVVVPEKPGQAAWVGYRITWRGNRIAMFWPTRAMAEAHLAKLSMLPIRRPRTRERFAA